MSITVLPELGGVYHQTPAKRVFSAVCVRLLARRTQERQVCDNEHENCAVHHAVDIALQRHNMAMPTLVVFNAKDAEMLRV